MQQQPRDCMQRIDAAENALIVTRALRTARHLDGSHGVRDGCRRRQQIRAALDNRVARVRKIAIRRQQLDDRAQPLPVGVEVGVVGLLRRCQQRLRILVAAERGLELVVRAPHGADRIDLERLELRAGGVAISLGLANVVETLESGEDVPVDRQQRCVLRLVGV